MITKRVQKALDDLDQAIAEQDAALAACREENAALIKDSARLDWLDEHGRQVPNIDGRTLGLYWGYVRGSERQSLRAAIDAAQEPSAQHQEGG